MINIFVEKLTIQTDIDEDNLVDNEILDRNQLPGNNSDIGYIEFSIMENECLEDDIHDDVVGNKDSEDESSDVDSDDSEKDCGE